MDDLFSTDLTFESLGLSPPLLRALGDLEFQHPTKVQAQLIPIALSGNDVLGQSKTGTGKTLAFGLPLLQMADPEVGLQALILVPTRELAIQVVSELREAARYVPVRVTGIFGGEKIRIQAQHLKHEPNIIVGTPGRVMDMHGRGLLPYDNIRCAVLDEVDRMLDIGFREDIRRILGTIKQQHQTIFVSATISEEIERLARQYMRNPTRLTVESKSLTVAQVTQLHFTVQPWDKKRLILHLLTHEEPALTLVFCRTKMTVDKLDTYLNHKGIEAHAIHGDMYQGKRNRVMQKLRQGKLSVLVASDLASRGLDVDGITHVINYDLPEDPDLYVHRIGRTARAGRDGIAWSFVTPEQGDLLTAIEVLTNVEIPRAEYDDFQPGPVPEDIVEQKRLAAKRQEELRVHASRNSLNPPGKQDAQDTTKFPGGIVPVAAPQRRMRGRVRSGRR